MEYNLIDFLTSPLVWAAIVVLFTIKSRSILYRKTVATLCIHSVNTAKPYLRA